MIKKIRFNRSYDALSTIVIFLMALNIRRLELYIIAGMFCFVLLFKKNKTIVVNMSIVILFLFSLFYTIIIVYKGNYIRTAVLTYFICPIAGYYIGYWLIRRDNYKCIVQYVLAIAIGRGLHGLLNMIPYLQGEYSGRNPIDFWTGSVLSSTGAGSLFIMSASLIYYSISIIEHKRTKGLIILLFAIASIFGAIQMGTRSCLIISVVVFVMCILVFTDFKNSVSVKTLIVAIIIIMLIYIAYGINLFDLKVAFKNSGLYRRMYVYEVESLGENARWSRQYYMITHLFEYPIGADDLTYTHNFWLDIARLTGLIPFTISVYLTILLLKSIYNGIISMLVNRSTKILLFSVTIGTFMIFFVEPVLEGMPSLYIMLIIISAMCEKIKHIKELEKLI